MIVRQSSPRVDSSRAIGCNSGTRPKPRSLNGRIGPAHFLERAKHYQLAAAMTDNAEEIERLRDVAFMFERMAHDVGRLREGQSRFSDTSRPKANGPPVVGTVGLMRTWHALAEFIRFAMPR